jgi:hypothetical protein
MSELRARAERQAAVGFQAVVAIENQQPFGSQRVVQRFGDAFADPVQIWRLRLIEKRQDQNRFPVERAAQQGGDSQIPVHQLPV